MAIKKILEHNVKIGGVPMLRAFYTNIQSKANVLCECGKEYKVKQTFELKNGRATRASKCGGCGDRTYLTYDIHDVVHWYDDYEGEYGGSITISKRAIALENGSGKEYEKEIEF